MLQYNKYIISRIAIPMLVICVSLGGIVWLTQSLRFIDLIVNRGLSVGTFLYLSSLTFPSLLWIILPISLFISVLFAYNKLTSESELIVMKSAGISRFGLLKPALIFAIFIMALSYLIALYLLPASYREFKDMQYFIRNNYASLLLQEGVFTSPTKGLTVYIRERGEDGMINGLIVHDSRSKGKVITMMAEKGQLVQGKNGPRFLLMSGNRQEIDKESDELSLLYFERYSLDLNIFNTGIEQKRWREPQERYLHELFYPDDDVEFMPQRLKAEAHHRLSWPLYNILLTLIALIPFLSGEFNRRGQGKKVVIVSVAAAIAVIWGLGLNNLVAKNAVFTFLVYLTVMGGILAIGYILLKKHRLE